MTFRPYLEFDSNVVFMQMWTKEKHPRWMFWKKTTYYMLVSTENGKLYKIDPDDEKLIRLNEEE